MPHVPDEYDEDEAVPVHLPPNEGPRPDWLLDAAIDPMTDGDAPASAAPKLTPGVPPPKPKRVPTPAPRPVTEASSGFDMGMMPSDPVADPDAQRSAPPPPRDAAPPPEPEPEPEPAGPRAWTAAASSVPVVQPRHSRTSANLPSIENPEDEWDEMPEAHEARGSAGPPAGLHAGPPPSVTIHSEPFWLIWLDELRTNRKIQIAVVVAFVLLVVIINAPWKDHGQHLSKVLANASALDGQPVRVSGRVGEIFNVAGGYAFYLHDGRDSIVVFTRTFRPLKKARIQVYGTVSTGILDGAPRAAIFEVPDPGKS